MEAWHQRRPFGAVAFISGKENPAVAGLVISTQFRAYEAYACERGNYISSSPVSFHTPTILLYQDIYSYILARLDLQMIA